MFKRFENVEDSVEAKYKSDEIFLASHWNTFWFISDHKIQFNFTSTFAFTLFK